jgi:hypothetical protein
MRSLHVVLIGALLAVSTAAVAEEPWELWEERMVGQDPVKMIFVARLPSSEACHAKAAELWNGPVPAGVTRLGYTCLPARPAPGPRGESAPPSG